MAVAKKKPWIGSKADEKQDKKEEKGMTPAQKKRFEKGDAKMDKDKTLTKKQDTTKDKALAKKVKAECKCGKCAACRARKKK